MLWRWYELRAASSGAVGAGDAFFFAADLRFAVAFFDDFGVAFFCFFAEDFGVVAFEASHGYSPFAHPPAETEASIRDAAAGKFRNKIQKSFRDGDYHHGDFVRKCLAPAADRMTKAGALDHAYFAGLDVGALRRSEPPPGTRRPRPRRADPARTWHDGVVPCFTGDAAPFEDFS